MRPTFCFVAIFAIVILPQPLTTLADHDMTCHPPESSHGNYFMWSPGSYNSPPSPPFFGEPGEELNLILPSAGGATSASCSGAGGNVDPFLLPPDSNSAVEHIPSTGEAGRYWLFEPASQMFLDTHVGLSSELPNFAKPDGTPLLTQYRQTNFDFVLQAARKFTPGEAFSVSSGEIGAWPGAVLLEMPASFTLDELLAADPTRFTAYTGAAQVVDIGRIGVVQLVPEPTSATMLIPLVGLLVRRRQSRFGRKCSLDFREQKGK